MSGSAYLARRYGMVSTVRILPPLPPSCQCYELLQKLRAIVDVHRKFWARRSASKTGDRLISVDAALLAACHRFEVNTSEAALMRVRALVRQCTASYVRTLLRLPQRGKRDGPEISGFFTRVPRDRETFTRLITELRGAAAMEK